MTDPSQYITVLLDADDERPFEVRLHDPGQGDDSPPGVEFQMTEDEAHELETQLRNTRLMRLGLEEKVIRLDDVEEGDIIGDLGFTVSRIDKLTSMFGEVKPIQLWDGDSRIWMASGREVSINRPVRGAVVEQPAELDMGEPTEDEQILVDFVRERMPFAKSGSQQSQHEVEQGLASLNMLMRQHMNNLDVLSARRVMLTLDALRAEVKA